MICGMVAMRVVVQTVVRKKLLTCQTTIGDKKEFIIDTREPLNLSAQLIVDSYF